MNREFVSSSTLRSIGYDETNKILEVEFKTGKLYQCHNVPKHLYIGLMSASSKGNFYDTFIKKAGFRCFKI